MSDRTKAFGYLMSALEHSTYASPRTREMVRVAIAQYIRRYA